MDRIVWDNNLTEEGVRVDINVFLVGATVYGVVLLYLMYRTTKATESIAAKRDYLIEKLDAIKTLMEEDVRSK